VKTKKSLSNSIQNIMID